MSIDSVSDQNVSNDIDSIPSESIPEPASGIAHSIELTESIAMEQVP